MVKVDFRVDFWLIVSVVVLLAATGFWYKGHREKKERARLALQQEIAKSEEAKAKKAAEAEEAARTLASLKSFIAVEEKKLKDVILETKEAMDAIEADKAALSEAVKAVGEKAKAIDEEYRRKKKKRYSEAERVVLLLNSPEINKLAKLYLGNDLATLEAEFKEKVKVAIRIHGDQSRRLRENRDEFYKEVEGLSEEVHKKNEKAYNQIMGVNANAEKTVNRLMKQRRRLESQLAYLQNSAVRQSTKIARVENEIAELDKTIEAANERFSSARSQLAHIQATMAETKAREDRGEDHGESGCKHVRQVTEGMNARDLSEKRKGYAADRKSVV